VGLFQDAGFYYAAADLFIETEKARPAFKNNSFPQETTSGGSNFPRKKDGIRDS
jgi:hypothetical protein